MVVALPSESLVNGEIPLVAKIFWTLGFILAGGSYCLLFSSLLTWLVLRLFFSIKFFDNSVFERLFFFGEMGLIASAVALNLGLLVFFGS
jgi:hypothetical protein